MDIKKFWDAVLRQDADAIREYFHPDAWVNWRNTNEHFTVEEFIRANCEYLLPCHILYPGSRW